MVGTETVKSLQSGCVCQAGKYGPFCNWNEPTDEAQKLCENGIYNSQNYLTGCECRIDGKVTPYHGWYCEIHNRRLCTDGKFFDVTEMSDKVGKCPTGLSGNKCCKNCGEIIKNCGLCKQDSENQCKLLNVLL